MNGVELSGLEPWLLQWLLVYCRIQACLISMPVFSERFLTLRVKVALAMALTPLFAAAAGAQVTSILGLTMLAVAEIATGLLLGAMVRILASALDMAATAIASTASLSQLMGVASEYSPHPVGNLFHLAGLGLLMALGFPMLVCDLLRESIALRPIGDWPRIDTLLPGVVSLVSRSFQLAMLLAAPFILGGFLFQALSGVVSKVMPSLPIVFIGAPLAILLAMVGLAILAPPILSLWAETIMNFTTPVAP